MGDSGNQLDDSKQGQNSFTLHGSIIRISLSSEKNADYGIPNGNPYKGGGMYIRDRFLPGLCPQN